MQEKIKRFLIAWYGVDDSTATAIAAEAQARFAKLDYGYAPLPKLCAIASNLVYRRAA